MTPARPPGNTRARIAGALVLLAVGAAIVVGRCNVMNASVDNQLERGIDALVQAIDGDRAQFVEAKRAFARAAGATFWEGFPVFMLELAQAIEEGREGIAHEAARPIMVALGHGHYEEAVAALPAVPSDFVGRANLERAVIALARRAAERKRE